jgi:hypothetical protein
MPKRKKKNVRIIEVEEVEFEPKNKDSKPTCFGNKEEYCTSDICGKWYEKCQKG